MSDTKFGITLALNGQDQVVRGIESVGTGFANLSTSGKRAEESADRLSAALGRVAHYGVAGIGVGSLAREFVQAADATTNMASRFKLLGQSMAEVGQTQSAVFAIAQTTRQSFETTADVYYKLAKGGEALGLSQAQVIGLTKTVSQSLALSGSSAESAKAALMQFGQALASGALRGDELNSVMEQAPALAEAIAKGMGRTTGELRQMGEAGTLSVQQIVAALEKSAPEIARQFSQVAPTVGGALTTVNNAFVKAAGDIDKQLGASSAAAQALQGLAGHMDLVAVAAIAVGTAISAKAAVSMLNMVGVSGLLTRTVQAETAVYSAEVLSIEALTAAQLRLTAAKTGATVATGALGSVVRLLGGPVGALATVAVTGAAAWAVWQSSTDGAAAAAQRAKNALKDTRTEAEQWYDLQVKLDALAKGSVTGNFKTSDKWRKAWQTPGQKKQEDIDELEALKKAQLRDARLLASRAERNAAELRIATEHQVKLANINEKYKPRELKDKAYDDPRHTLAVANIAIQKDLQKQLEKTGEAAVASTLAALEATQPWNDALDTQIAKINEDTLSLTLNAEQLQAHTVLLALQKSGLEEGSEAWTLYGQKMAAALAANDAAKLGRRAADDAANDWKRVTDDINRALTDALMKGGKKGLDYLKDYARTLVLRPIISAAMSPLTNAAGGVFGGGSVGAGGTASGLFSAAGGASSLYNFATGNVGAGAYGAFAGSSLGQTLGLSQGTLMGPTASGAALEGTALTGLGTAMPYVAAAVVAYSLIAKRGGGPKTEGGYANDASAANLTRQYTDAGYNSLTQGIVEGVARSYVELVTQLGGTPGTLTGSAFVSSDPRGTAATIFQELASLNGKSIYGSATNIGRTDADIKAAAEVSSANALIAALEATDGLPRIIETYLDSIKNTQLTAEQAAAAINRVKLYDQILDAVDVTKTFAAMSKADTLAGMTEFNRFAANGENLRSMAHDFDGSLASAQALASATQTMYTDQLALVRQIQAAAEQTHQSFAASARSVGLDVLDNQGKYNFYSNEAETYRDILSTLTDPTLIASYADKLNSAMMAAWGVLDADQRASSAGQFQTLFGEADTLVAGRFNNASSQVSTLGADLTTAVNNAFTAGIERMVTAITNARSPIALTVSPVEVDVRVSTTVAARSELTGVSGGRFDMVDPT